MADTIKSKVFLTLNYSVLEAILEVFSDAWVDKDGVYLITRGSILHDFLKEKTKGSLLDVITAEHSSSQDMYSTVYTVEYKYGTSETIGIEKSEPVIRELDQTEVAELLKDLEEQELNVDKKSVDKKEVNKELIPALLKATEGQKPKRDPGPILRSGQENFELEIAVGKMMSEDIERGYDDKIDIMWICNYIRELIYDPFDIEEIDYTLGIDDFIYIEEE